MRTATALGQDFIELIEHKETLIGRELVIRELGLTFRGPISDIRQVSPTRVLITLEWLARDASTADEEIWLVSKNEPVRHNISLRSIRVAEENGAITIAVPLSWEGEILSEDTPRLEKKTAEDGTVTITAPPAPKDEAPTEDTPRPEQLAS